MFEHSLTVCPQYFADSAADVFFVCFWEIVPFPLQKLIVFSQPLLVICKYCPMWTEIACRWRLTGKYEFYVVSRRDSTLPCTYETRMLCVQQRFHLLLAKQTADALSRVFFWGVCFFANTFLLLYPAGWRGCLQATTGTRLGLSVSCGRGLDHTPSPR